MNALCFEFGMNARTAILTPIGIIRIFNTLCKLFVIPFSFALSSRAPIVVAIFWNTQDVAHAKNRKLVTMLMNKVESYRRGRTKMLTAFFNISLSCRNISISRFSFLFSSSMVVWWPLPGNASSPCSPNSLHHLLKALSEIPRSLAICVLLFPLVSNNWTACCLNSFV